MDQSPSEIQEQARRRAAVVFKVRSGQITAREGAKLLGVSRKTYYEWESRALQAMTEAMEDQPTGRPKKPQDEEKTRLQEKIADLERKLFIAEKTAEVREMLHLYEQHCAGTDNGTGALQEKKRLKKKR